VIRWTCLGAALRRTAVIAALVGNVATAAAADDVPAQQSGDGDDGKIARDGNSLFNQYCSHCHGPNAVQGERPRVLRRLRIRYGDNRAQVFQTTVAKGRPEKGMPTWGGVLDEGILRKIWAFLETVQK
jgi:mono/diheme cytochrome c family protein